MTFRFQKQDSLKRISGLFEPVINWILFFFISPRRLVEKRVIMKLPDYCEEVKLEKDKKVKAECQKRAKRIKQRILARNKLD